MLSQVTAEASNQMAKRAAALVFPKAKTRVWDEFNEAMEKDFWLASRKFWQNIRKEHQEKKAGPVPGNAWSWW